MTCIKRISETKFDQTEHGLFSFVPLLKNKAQDMVDKSTQAIADDTVKQLKDSMPNMDK